MESNQKNKREKSTSSLDHLKVNRELITDRKQTADLIASTISSNSSSKHHSMKFQAIEMQKNKRKNNLSLLQQTILKNITYPSYF